MEGRAGLIMEKDTRTKRDIKKLRFKTKWVYVEIYQRCFCSRTGVMCPGSCCMQREDWLQDFDWDRVLLVLWLKLVLHFHKDGERLKMDFRKNDQRKSWLLVSGKGPAPKTLDPTPPEIQLKEHCWLHHACLVMPPVWNTDNPIYRLLTFWNHGEVNLMTSLRHHQGQGTLWGK